MIPIILPIKVVPFTTIKSKELALWWRKHQSFQKIFVELIKLFVLCSYQFRKCKWMLYSAEAQHSFFHFKCNPTVKYENYISSHFLIYYQALDNASITLLLNQYSLIKRLNQQVILSINVINACVCVLWLGFWSLSFLVYKF